MKRLVIILINIQRRKIIVNGIARRQNQSTTSDKALEKQKVYDSREVSDKKNTKDEIVSNNNSKEGKLSIPKVMTVEKEIISTIITEKETDEPLVTSTIHIDQDTIKNDFQNTKSAYDYNPRNEVDKNKVQQEIKLQHNTLTKGVLKVK